MQYFTTHSLCLKIFVKLTMKVISVIIKNQNEIQPTLLKKRTKSINLDHPKTILMSPHEIV